MSTAKKSRRFTRSASAKPRQPGNRLTAYRIRRIEPRSGVGPLEVFRAVNTINPVLSQTPQNWLRNMAWFQELEANPTPEAAVSMYVAPPPGGWSFIPKAWTELAYEEMRLQIRPRAPSRLACLFAMLDPLEALSFTEETGNSQVIFKGSVNVDVPWATIDMTKFLVQLDGPGPWTPQQLVEARVRALILAAEYWSEHGPLMSAEVLVGGGITLTTPRLRLIPTLQALGVVEAVGAG